MKVRHMGTYITVNPDDPRNAWSFPDPAVAPSSTCASAFEYLVSPGITTKDAMKKLADMRRALKLARAPSQGSERGTR